jgi:hypothetical protein
MAQNAKRIRFFHISSWQNRQLTLDERIEARERAAAKREERKRKQDEMPCFADRLTDGFAMLNGAN